MYPLMPGIFQRQWKQLVSAAQSEPSFWAKRSNLARVLAVERRGCHLLILRGLIKACSKQSVVAMLSTSAPTKCTAPSAEDWGSGVLQVVLPETGRLAAAAERRASTAAVESKEISLAKKSVASIAFDVDVPMSSLDTLVTERYRWKLMFVEHRYIIWCDDAHVMHCYAICICMLYMFQVQGPPWRVALAFCPLAGITSTSFYDSAKRSSNLYSLEPRYTKHR